MFVIIKVETFVTVRPYYATERQRGGNATLILQMEGKSSVCGIDPLTWPLLTFLSRLYSWQARIINPVFKGFFPYCNKNSNTHW